jgi:hypothetical protein
VAFALLDIADRMISEINDPEERYAPEDRDDIVEWSGDRDALRRELLDGPSPGLFYDPC